MELYFNGTAMAVICIYYLLINVVQYLTMAFDKKRAVQGKWRVPEKNLYILAILGGGLGGLIGMVVKRHKNRHMDFILVFTVTAILHIMVAYLLIGKLVFHV